MMPFSPILYKGAEGQVISALFFSKVDARVELGLWALLGRRKVHVSRCLINCVSVRNPIGRCDSLEWEASDQARNVSIRKSACYLPLN